MVNVKNDFTGWDYAVFAGMLAISMGIGVYFAFIGGKQKTQGEYLMANRSLSVIPVAISILVSFLSAILILGTPAEIYNQGTEYFLVTIGMSLGVVLASVLWVPLLYPLKITSVFEYLEKRYQSRPARLVGTGLMILTQIIYMGIASFAPSTALEAVTGFPVWGTILIIGVVATFYTTLGGIKAVVWTDVFQALIMVGGVFAICVQGTIKVGGMSKVWETMDKWDRISFFNWDPNPTVRHTVWSLVIGSALQWMGTYGFNQSSVQRYSSLSTLGKARSSVLLTIVGTILLVTMTTYTGMTLFAYYALKNCDPLDLDLVDTSNQLIPYFVMEILAYPGVPGLFISCLFSGALSSVSSSLSALAAITWEDFLKPSFDKKLTESKKTTLTKFIVLGYGCCAIGMSFMAKQLEGTVLQAAISLIGAAAGPLTGMFLMGALFPWANAKGAISGALVGLCVSMWISIGAYITGIPLKDLPFPNGTSCDELTSTMNLTTTTTTMMTTTTTMAFTDSTVSNVTVDGGGGGASISDIYSISYMWYNLIGILCVHIIGLPVSFITGANSIDDVPTKYQVPLFSRLFCCLPNKLLYFLNCRRHFEDPAKIRSDEKDEEFIVDPPEVKDGQKPEITKNGQKNKEEGGIFNIAFDPDLDLQKPKYANGTHTTATINGDVTQTKEGGITGSPPPSYDHSLGNSKFINERF